MSRLELVVDGVRVVIGEPEPSRCADCSSPGPVLVRFARLDGAARAPLCAACARDVLPEPERQAEAPARRPGRKRTRQAGG